MIQDGFNVELPLGEDSSNNSYSSTNVVSNPDGSILERLEYLQYTLLEKLGVIVDTAANKTLLGYQNSLYQHVHQPSKVYPTLADGVIVTGGVGAWALGAAVQEIIPINTINTWFDIHHINFENASATDVYEFVLYEGSVGNEVEIGRVRTARDTVQSGVAKVPIQIAPQVANTRISAKVASKSGGGDTVTVSVMYHAYS